MSKNITIPKVKYGSGHTRRYSKSPLADFLVQCSTDDIPVVHFCNDVHILLRQKNLHKTIGVDVLRSYFENIDNGSPDSHHFSDDELFSLIDPKGLGTITDAYEFSKYIEKTSVDLKERYKTLKRESKLFKD